MLPSGDSLLRLHPRPTTHAVSEAGFHVGARNRQDTTDHNVCCHSSICKASSNPNVYIPMNVSPRDIRFSSHEFFSGISPRLRGSLYAQKSASFLDPSDVSLSSVQACVLLGACRIMEGDAAGESVYYGIACRMAQLLDLPHASCQGRLEREINIRGWYCSHRHMPLTNKISSLAYPLHGGRVVQHRSSGAPSNRQPSTRHPTANGRDVVLTTS